MILFVLTVIAAVTVATGLALIALSVLTFIAAWIAGQMRGRPHHPHQPMRLFPGHH